MLRKRFYPYCSVCCEQGDRRDENQDRVFSRTGTIKSHSVGLFFVADGCGGLTHGGRISQFIVDCFDRIWEQELPETIELTDGAVEPLMDTMTCWLKKINAVAFDFSRLANSRVGSTLSLLLTIDRDFGILNVGDSRVYLYRSGKCRQLTEDQSFIADMLRNGEISEEDAACYPRRNGLTMCVGGFEQLQIYKKAEKLKRNDVFLLCSDGLYNALGHRQLLEQEPRHISQDSACMLRNMIPPGAAKDNVSAILVEVCGEMEENPCWNA